MIEANVINYVIQNQFELNLSYMPFIIHGGIFVPTNDTYKLGETVLLDLNLPGYPEALQVQTKVVWITPKNSIHHIYPGVGLQFIGDKAKAVNDLIQARLDTSADVGGYTYGMGMST